MNPLNYNRYSYVLNNPLKYTDPSGYKKLNQYEMEDLRESESAYYEMMGIINEWNFRSYGRGGGGAGGSSYGNYINSVHQNPNEWVYDYSTMTYINRRTGGRISPTSQAGRNILYSIGLNRYLEEVGVEYLAYLIVLNQGEASNRVNSEGSDVFNYVSAILSAPTKINKSDGSIVYQILIWMEYIDQNRDLDIHLGDIVNSSLFNAPFNRVLRGLPGKEGSVEYWIQNPKSSPAFYDRYPIEYVKYDEIEISISIMLMSSDTRSSEGPRVIYIQSNDSELIWNYYSNIKHYFKL